MARTFRAVGPVSRLGASQRLPRGAGSASRGTGARPLKANLNRLVG